MGILKKIRRQIRSAEKANLTPQRIYLNKRFEQDFMEEVLAPGSENLRLPEGKTAVIYGVTIVAVKFRKPHKRALFMLESR